MLVSIHKKRVPQALVKMRYLLSTLLHCFLLLLLCTERTNYLVAIFLKLGLRCSLGGNKLLHNRRLWVGG